MLNKKISKNSIFPKSKNMGPRVWGTEQLLVHIKKKLTLKKIIINKSKKGGLQYHHKKNECGYVISGKLRINYDLGCGKLKSKTLKPGDIFHFSPGLVHQEHALTKCVIIEASTPYFNDRVRVEKKYGLKQLEGLSSTKSKEIKFL
jgi:mannose-6-phosphate isomerase-like protein (cupin superfamily)